MTGFLYRDEVERQRLLDLMRLLRRPILLALPLLFIPVILATKDYGWAMTIPLGIGAISFGAASWALDRIAHPDWAFAASWLVSMAMIQVSFALAHGSHEYLYTPSMVTTVLLAMTFGRRFVIAGTALTIVAVVFTGLAFDHAEVVRNPPLLFVPCTLFVALALLGVVVRDADIVSRGTAVVDPLTGVLNRIALQARLSELEAQTRARPQQVAMVVADIDRFKGINDAHGHALGDRVLTQVAARMRAALDATATLYRFGGEEFVALLPAADIPTAIAVAERLRAAVGAAPVEQVAITVSCGVSASSPGAAFDRHRVFEAADAALFTAKRSGRDQTASAAPRQAGEPAATYTPEPSHRAADSSPPVIAPSEPAALKDTRRGATWLVRNDVQREQLVDISDRTRLPALVAALLALASLIARAPWYGWLPIIPSVGLIAVLVPIQSQLRDRRRPELALFFSMLATLIATSASVALMAPAALFSLALCVQIVYPACVALPRRGAILIWAWAAALMALVALLRDPGAALHLPNALMLPEAQLAAMCIMGDALGRSTIEHRSLAIVDQLTGVLNRVALDARLPEVEYATGLSGNPVAVVVADIDHFKSVNDAHGHERGDAVLREVAQRMCGVLRTFDAVYRVGGEEFVVLLDNAASLRARELAERMRAAVAETPAAGLAITMSFGVCTSLGGGRFDYNACFAAADSALYLAKAQGRNRVVIEDAITERHEGALLTASA